MFPDALGEPGTLSVAASVGAASEGVAFMLSPGRKEMAPQLVLSYSSMAGWGQAGQGWALDPGRIERWRGDGTPSVGPANAFSFSLAGAGGELQRVDGDLYRARIESRYREFRLAGGAWEMFDGQGYLYRFGSSDESRLTGGGTDQVWMLDRVEDAVGNSVTYSYETVGQVPHLAEIRYTGFGDDPGENRVVFGYESRPDARTSYGRSVREEQDRRLESITVEAGGSLTARYELSYRLDPLNRQSLLEEIRLVGADGISSIPLRRLGYTERAHGWSAPLAIDLPVLADDDGRDTGVRLVDVNGDTYADVVDDGESVRLGDGFGGFHQDASWTSAIRSVGVDFVIGSGKYQGAETGVRLVDVNGDARIDLFIAQPTRREVWLNTGSGWALDPSWTASLGNLCFAAEAWGDPNLRAGTDPSGCSPPPCDGPAGEFDGCTPADAQHPPDCELGEEGCYPEQCGSSGYPSGAVWPWVFPIVEPFSIVDDTGDSKGVELTDVNGDGRLDIVWAMTRGEGISWMFYGSQGFPFRTPGQIRGVFLNTGSGWQKHSGLTQQLWALKASDGTAVEFASDTKVQGYGMLDVNGDGLSDIIRTLGNAPREVFLATGAGWERDPAMSSSLTSSQIISLNKDREGLGLVPADLNDDGLVDYVRSTGPSGGTWAYENTGTGWVSAPALQAEVAATGVGFAASDGTSSGVTLADLNGDGLSDIVAAKQGSDRRAWMSSGTRSGLLETSATALGERTSVSWGTSSDFPNVEDGVQGLPMVFPVVTALTRSDGRHNDYVTAYSYEGGRFEDRALRGFAASREMTPSGMAVVRRFHQDEARAGHIYLEEAHDSSGNLSNRKTSTYEVVDAYGGIRQVQFTGHSEETIDDPATHRFGWASTTTYDEKLRGITAHRDLDLSATGEEVDVTTEYAENLGAGIWSTLARTTTRDAQGEIVAQEIIRYDGPVGGPSLPEGEVERGLPTELHELVEPDTYVTQTQRYDDYGNVIAITDRNGHTSEYAYDSATATFRTEATDAEGNVVRTQHDPRFGSVVRDIDAGGRETQVALDAFGRVTRVTLPGDESSPSGTRTYEYSELDGGSVNYYDVHETETSGEAGTLDRRVFFDGFGQVYRVEREGAERTIVETSEFDDAGNVIEVSRPFFEGDAPKISGVERDEMHRPTRVTEPDGVPVVLNYRGAWVDTTDRNGNPTRVRRDPFGNVVEIREGEPGAEETTRYAYDSFGRMTEMVDALGEETHISYDALGRRVRLDDPTTGAYRYRYDGEGNLVEQVSPDDASTRFEYDRVGNMLEKELPDGEVVEIEYGPSGEPVYFSDAPGELSVRYDERGNVTERRRTVLGDTYVTGYEYDSLGRPVRVEYPDSFTVLYEYDSGGNLSEVTDGTGRSIAEFSGHNAAGQTGATRLGNGAESSYAYDEMLRMTALQTSLSDGTALQDLSYNFDPDSNVLSIEDHAFNGSQSFEYDSLGRLVSARGSYGHRIYEYDALGNLLRKGDLAFAVDPDNPQQVTCGARVEPDGGKALGQTKNPKPETCDASVLDEIAIETGVDRADLKDSFDILYDASGNVVQKGAERYEYDGENRLVRVRSANGKLIERNTYDSAGQRVVQWEGHQKTVFIDGIYEIGKTHVSRHIRAGADVVATVIAPKATVDFREPTTGGPGASGAAIALLAAGLLLAFRPLRRLPRGFVGVIALSCASVLITQTATPAYAAQPRINQAQAEQRFYYHSNHLGSVDVVTDDKGHEIERRQYTPYGEAVDWAGANAGPRELLEGFGGHRYDDTTGLYYFGARHYDPQLGRFLTADTQIPDPLEPKQLNRYAFAAGNPIRYVDPTGHAWYDWVITGLVIVLAVVVSVVTVGLATGFAAGAIAATLGILLAAAVVGGGIAALVGIYAQGLEGAELWQTILLGAAIGAAIGAGIVSVAMAPTALAAVTTKLGFVATKIGLGAMMGMATGAVAQTVANYAAGGSVEDLFGWDLFKSVGIGLVVGGATGFIAGTAKLAWAGAKSLFTGTFSLQAISKASASIGPLFWTARYYDSFTLLWAGAVSAIFGVPHLFGTDILSKFRSSPARSLGVPSSVFSGTWPGQLAIGSISPHASALATMPLAP